jgi:xanthine/uracil permease
MEQDKKQGGFVLTLQSLQWMIFVLANVLAPPIVIGAAFDLSAAETSAFIQRSMVVAGIVTTLQYFFGHRLPLIEGSAGMWWALFLVLGALAVPGEKGAVLQNLEGGMIIAGAAVFIISLLPVIGNIRRLFTPLVTGVYLILLCVQMSNSFFKGMFGVSRYAHVDWTIAGLSLLVILIVLLCSLKGKGLVRNLGPMIGILTGWGIAAWLGLTDGGDLATAGHGWFLLPELFAWGPPGWDVGTLLTSLLTGLILISNLVASMLVMGKTLGLEISNDAYAKGLRLNGAGGVASGLFSVIAPVPLSVSAGFIMTTGIRGRTPFLIGALLVAIAGFFPAVGHLFATLPAEVAYAALFVPFTQMLGFGVADLMGQQPSQRNLLVIGLSLMAGTGFMFLPSEALLSVAPAIRSVLANGLLMGLLLCLLLEHVVFRQKPQQETEAAPASH